MKILTAFLLLAAVFSAQASPMMTMKERLRLHLWSHGLEDRPIKVKAPQKAMPEELERALRKI